MQTLLIVLVALALIAMYVTWTAGRLDRQHVRVEAGRSALDAALVRRSALAEELAELARTRSPGPDLEPVQQAARAARGTDQDNRERAENDLTRVLRPLVNRLTGQAAATADPQVGVLLEQLAAATSRIGLARNIYNGAVDHTLALRRRRVVRWLRLAGRAAAPAYFEIDDTTLANDVSTKGRNEP